MLLWALDMVIRKLFSFVCDAELLDLNERFDYAWLDGCLNCEVVMKCERT